MLALKRAMILGIVVFLIVWTVLLSIGQFVGSARGANATLPPTLVSPANDTWVTENKPTFTWIFNDSQSGFNLQISNETNFVAPVQNITVKSSTQNYTLITALNDGMYYWRVRTNDTSGVWSDWSIAWLVKIDTVPPSLSDNAPAGWQTTKPITVTLTASDATSGVSKVSYKKWLVAEPVDYTEGTSIVLDTEGKWNVKYKTVDAAGNSAEETKEVWIDTTRPNSVTVFQPRKWTELEVGELEIGVGEFIELNWTASDEPYFKQYELYVSTDPSVLGTKKATIMGVGSTTYTIEVSQEGLDPGTTYYLSVVVVDQAGLSSEAATVSVTTNAQMNWPLMGGIAVAVEVAIAAIFVVIKLFIRKE